MGNVLRDGSSWLARKLQEHASRPVRYQRGALEVVVLATVGKTLLKLDDGYGSVRIEWTDRDFLIPAADLVLGGSVVLPERGDVIRESEGTTIWVYEVLAPGSEPVWRWSDGYHQMLRIHTKQIARETV